MSSNALESSQMQPTLSPTEALWAHVLRKDKLSLQPRNLDMPQVPAAPVDRNATSTRILLYDTQARLEQFSSRADAMLKSMQDANYQLKTVGMLFEKDRDTLTNDMIDLVNRSQTEIQKTIGKPAQEPQFSAFQEKMELRVEGLNQRLDALQMFNQTHCQALETHSQFLKSIQDQQNALLSAVLPLLPLVQVLPSQIDQIKTSIQEATLNLTSNVVALKQDIVGSLSQSRSAPSSRKRRLSGQSATCSPVTSKKPRRELPVSSPPTSTGSDDKVTNPQPLHSKTPKPAPVPSPIVPRTVPSPAKLVRQRSVFATPQHRPVTNLTPSALPSRTISAKNSPSLLLKRIVSPSQKFTSTAAPQTLALSQRAHDSSNHSAEALLPIVFRPVGQTFNTSPQQQSLIGYPKRGARPRELSTLAPSSHPSPAANTAMHSRQLNSTALNVPLGLRQHPTSSFVVVNRMTSRRSPPREGRRFIPLDDDDDDDDDEERGET